MYTPPGPPTPQMGMGNQSPTAAGQTGTMPGGVLPQAQVAMAAQAQAQGQLQMAQQAFATTAQQIVSLADTYPDCQQDLEQAASIVMGCLAKVAAATQPELGVPPS